MKKKLIKIFISVAVLLMVVGVITVPNEAQASCASLVTFNFGECITEGTALIGNVFLGAAAYLITVTGALLSFSIKLTLNIKDIYDQTPAIENTWKVIRDISSIFIIFILLYASISTIVGIGKTGIKDVIGKVIIVGLLINFSLFFTKVAIDTSNLISLQFYRAIAPESTSNTATGSAYLDGGLSNIFMNSLKIQSIYHPTNADVFKDEKGEGSIFTSIIIATMGGSVLMVFAALSFLAAAVAFSIRTGILLLLMVFSPLYFIGMILPSIKSKVSSKWEDMLTGQLIFMPVYLLLMYVALRIIGDGGFLSFIQDKKPTGGFINDQTGIIIQYFIAILFINAPLIAAIDLGGRSTKWGESVKGWAGDRLKGGAGFLGQHTVGRGARAAQEAFKSSNIATKNPNLAILANKTLGGVAGTTFGGSKGGYDKRFKNYEKERSDFGKKVKASKGDKATFVQEGLGNWNTKVEFNEAQYKYQLDRMKTATSLKDRTEAEENARKLSAEIAAMRKAEKEDGQIKYLEEKADKEAKLEFARLLEKKAFFGIGKASKEAADNIRKELSKGKDKKLIDAIKDLGKDEGKGEGEDKGDKK